MSLWNCHSSIDTQIVMFVSRMSFPIQDGSDWISSLDADLGHTGTSTSDGATTTAECLEGEEQGSDVADEQEPHEYVTSLDLATLLLVVSGAESDVIATLSAQVRTVNGAQASSENDCADEGEEYQKTVENEHYNWDSEPGDERSDQPIERGDP